MNGNSFHVEEIYKWGIFQLEWHHRTNFYLLSNPSQGCVHILIWTLCGYRPPVCNNTTYKSYTNGCEKACARLKV